MPYIGNTAADRFVASKAASVYSGDGSTTAFTLEHAVGSDEDILVSVDGVIQEPSVAYAVSSGTTLTFTAAPSTNSGNNIFVYYLFRTVATVDHPSTSSLQATDGTFSSTLNVTGETTLATHLNLGDNDKIKLGASADLQIYHDATNNLSIIEDVGSGILAIKGSTNIDFVNAENTKYYARFVNDSSVSLFHNGTQKFETTSSGVTVTGNATVSGEVLTSTINTASSTGTLTLFGGATNKGGTIELSGGNNTGSTGSGIVFKTGASTGSPSEKMRIDQTGAVTKPLQPAFFAEPSSTQSDIAANSLLQVGFATERFDQNSDYNPTISTFTAPVTGKYQFNAIIRLDNIDTAASYYLLRFTTSNRDHTFLWQPKYSADPQYFSYTLSSLADMDASDTCVVKVYQTGGSQQTDINADSRFSGYLVC